MGERIESIDFPKVSILYSNVYTKVLHGPALMAVIFGFWDELVIRMVECALQSDMPLLNILLNSYPLYITLNNGRIRISNYEKG